MPSFCRAISSASLAAIALSLSLGAIPPKGPLSPAASVSYSLRAALCPIVYPVDQSQGQLGAASPAPPGPMPQVPSDSSSPRGTHFLFFGNAFFINRDGYLLTAAHVLSQLHGGQPYILIRPPSSPARIQSARIVAVDIEHDIALLRAVPNPFLASNDISALPLSAAWPQKTSTVTAAALFPENAKDAHTGDAFVETDPSGRLLDYEFSALYKGKPETELFLFSHEIAPGQSGAPVVASGSDGVVGLVEGRWLREDATTLGLAVTSPGSGVGAAIPIHYAIWLLQQKGIAWQAATENPASGVTSASASTEPLPPNLPMPLSLVTAPYPAESLTGGEVSLDTLVDPKGRFAEIRVVRGEEPFLSDVLSAVRTWTFIPAQQDGRAVFARLGITFQFPQSLRRAVPAATHSFDAPPARDGERSPIPILTVEPSLPAGSDADGSVVLYESLDAQAAVTSSRILQIAPGLADAALAAARDWRFVPSLHSGSPQLSAAILVFTFRRSPRLTLPKSPDGSE